MIAVLTLCAVLPYTSKCPPGSERASRPSITHTHTHTYNREGGSKHFWWLLHPILYRDKSTFQVTSAPLCFLVCSVCFNTTTKCNGTTIVLHTKSSPNGTTIVPHTKSSMNVVLYSYCVVWLNASNDVISILIRDLTALI